MKAKWRTERLERLLFRPHPLLSCYGGGFVLDPKLEKEVSFVSMKLLANQKSLDRLLLNRNSNLLSLAKSASCLLLKENSSLLGKSNVTGCHADRLLTATSNLSLKLKKYFGLEYCVVMSPRLFLSSLASKHFVSFLQD